MATVQEILTEIPRPTFQFRPGYQAPLPEGMTLTRPSAAQTKDPVSGLYTSVPSGQKRNFGPQQNFLIEREQRTNRVRYSAENTDANRGWGGSFQSEAIVSSIIEDGKGVKLAHNGDGGWLRSSYICRGGVTSGGVEVLSMIVEEGSQKRDRMNVRDDDTGEIYADAQIDWKQSPPVAENPNNNSDKVYLRKLFDNGPNGGRVYRLVARGTAPSDGNNRRADLLMVGNGPPAGSEAIIHHAQIEEALNASLPIVTQGNAVTRGAEDVTVDVRDWWNPNGGLFLIEFMPRAHKIDRPFIVKLSSGNTGIRYASYKGETTFDLFLNADTTNYKENNVFEPFNKYRVAVSWNKNEINAVVNGTPEITNQPPEGFLNPPSKLSLSGRGTENHTLRHFSYTPVFHPTTESDRSAGDPPSLETLTTY